jgi:hypothetical protein
METARTLIGPEVINERDWLYHERFASRTKFEIRSSVASSRLITSKYFD